MNKILSSIIAFVFIFSSQSFSQSPSITTQELEEHVGYLASDDLGGRLPGTENDKQAAAYIAGEFEKAGVELLGENGFQYFDVVTGVDAGKGNELVHKELKGRITKDFIPLSFSKNTTLEAEVAFVGYGFQVKNDTIRIWM